MSKSLREQNVKKYKSLAKAVIANDVQASKDFIEVLKENDKELTEEEIKALGLRWFLNDDRQPEMINFLNDLGFDFSQSIILDAENENVGTRIPFRLVGNEDDEKFLKELLKRKAIKPSITDGIANSLLVESLEQGRFSLSEEFVKTFKMDINKANLKGQTALHIMAGNLKFEAVEWLCSHNADPTIEDLQGAVASEVVPEDNKEWDADAMYDNLEDYANAFKTKKSFSFSNKFKEMIVKENKKDSPSNNMGSLGNIFGM